MESLVKCCICNGKNNGECITIGDKKYHLNCIEGLANKPISYDRLLEIAKKMHLWIFLHSDDEFAIYDELGLTDEENELLGSIDGGKFTTNDPEVVNHIKNLIDKIDNN